MPVSYRDDQGLTVQSKIIIDSITYVITATAFRRMGLLDIECIGEWELMAMKSVWGFGNAKVFTNGSLVNFLPQGARSNWFGLSRWGINYGKMALCATS